MSSGLTRRGALTVVGGGAAFGGLALSSGDALGATSPGGGDAESPANAVTGKLNTWLADNPLFNRENAAKVLAEAGVDALLVSNPTGIYHLTSVNPITNMMTPKPFENYALLTADPRQPVRLLLFDFTYYFLVSDVRPGPWLETRLYSSPAGDGISAAANPPTMFRVPDGGVLTADEQRRRDEVTAMVPEMAASAGAGLVKMLREAGLANGRIASDSPLPAEHCEKASLDTEFVDADRILGLIRRVKSPIEIDLMRHAANQNALAVVASASTLRAGASISELRTAYFTDATKAGGINEFMAVDRATSPRYDRILRDGHAFMVDGVSSFNGYHGDFGRTVFLGEPNRRMAAMTAQIAIAWQAIREKMVPGTTFGQLLETGADSIKRSGMDVMARFNVHSVGLWHTDDPFGQTPDQWLGTVLESGMIISVDCPLFDEGVGGSSHYEDLTLITDQGPVALNTEFPAALIV